MNLPTKKLFNHRDEFVSSFDRIFDNLVKTTYPEITKSFGIDFFEKSSYPKMNVAVTEHGVEIVAEIPGLTREDVKIKFNEDVLTITGEKKAEPETSEIKTYIMRELKRSSFARSLKFHQPVVANKITADFKDGVLNVFAPWETPKEASKEVFININ